MLNLSFNTGEAPNFARVYEAAAKDEQKVADLFKDVLSSEAERNVALSLGGVDAESFMDALQQTALEELTPWEDVGRIHDA
ncbi:hypothetical protein V5O48_002856 [Marasmius crinis-equi]|uniref:Uncharacterized protein n=1 Tax=Marasmius crinis-equi TaxID=585013 RepID=A0ABR3FV25_9AGAR